MKAQPVLYHNVCIMWKITTVLCLLEWPMHYSTCQFSLVNMQLKGLKTAVDRILWHNGHSELYGLKKRLSCISSAQLNSQIYDVTLNLLGCFKPI